ALIAGGFMAALVGGVVFGEALGIHFVTPEPHEADAEKEISWEEVLGLDIPSTGFLHKTGQPEAAAAEGALVTHASEVEEKKGLLEPHSDVHLSVNGWFNLGYYSKVHDIKALLLWSVLIGFVHLVLGLILGVRNVYVRHGAKLAIQEKAAWLGFIAGLGVLVWGITSHNRLALAGGGGFTLASVTLLCMGAAHTVGVWWIALLELPSLFGNLLSYTRLAAIGASKAGMAIAFTAIGFDLLGGGDHHSVVGWVIYVLGFLGIIVLSILAGTLQSLRLQFVEFFSKFYQGGGRPYVPFGRRAP
ncbi:MAG TPA: hypothetical protein VI796_03090, partial [Candidatus Thermoplasmatota archaeon]|nr:hypothetical protein [Candidatus Thermoplasmatota archaeon]